MLNIFGRPHSTRFCDGVSRRDFLRIGGLAMGGMALPQILRAEQASGSSKSHKAVIMIFLPGGPPHQDMWDIKTQAPSEIRGEFSPIATNIPGIQIGEMFPRMAGMMDKFTVIRSIVGCDGPHDAYQCVTGWKKRERQPAGGQPSLGSVLSKVHGPADPAVPAFVGLSPPMGHIEWADNGKPGYLGVPHAPFMPNGDGRADMVLNGLTLDRFRDRRTVLTSLDRFRREADTSGNMTGMDAFTERAFGVLTSSKLADALDLTREDPKLRDRYGRGFNQLKDDGGPRSLDNFLIARRLISAGVRCVTLGFSRWDWHGANFRQGREEMPMLDQAVTALVEDLEFRGMLDDVSVVVWGEFGRTPKINEVAGRDHWPQVGGGLLAGGGMRTGQVIGATNRLGEFASERPVHVQEVFASLYRNMGINVDHFTLPDLQGRPQYLIDQNKHRPIPELV